MDRNNPPIHFRTTANDYADLFVHTGDNLITNRLAMQSDCRIRIRSQRFCAPDKPPKCAEPEFKDSRNQQHPS